MTLGTEEYNALAAADLAAEEEAHCRANLDLLRTNMLLK